MIYGDKSVDPAGVGLSGSRRAARVLRRQVRDDRAGQLPGAGHDRAGPKGFNWAMFPPLKGKTQDQAANPQTLSISAQSQHKAEAMQFIAYALNTAEHGQARAGRLADPGAARRRRRSSSSRRSTTAAGANAIVRGADFKKANWVSLDAYPRWKAEIATAGVRPVPRQPDQPATSSASSSIDGWNSDPRLGRVARRPAGVAQRRPAGDCDREARVIDVNGHLLTDRAVGCLAGAAVGDALGGATEGWESHEIHDHFGGWVEGDRRSRSGTHAERAEAVLAVLEGRRPRHRRHADDARARPRLRRQARPPRRLRRRAR